MKKRLSIAYQVALGGAILPILGCSSGSVMGPVADRSQAASSQVAAVLFVQQWGQILWGLVANQTGTHPASSGEPIFTEDAVIQSFTAADGTEAVLTTSLLDGSGTLVMTYPDGRTQTAKQFPPDFDGVSVTTTRWQVTDSEGLTVNYVSVVDDRGTWWDVSDDTTELQGKSTLPNAQTQQFHVTTAGGSTRIESDQSDDSRFTLEVPLADPDFVFPDFSPPATGRYVSPGFDIHFTLEATSAAESRWAKLVSDFGSGLTGEFSLNADFSGSGRLLQDSQPIVLLAWSQRGTIQLSFLSGESAAASPAGAALDFLVHRWQTLQALLAPSPGGRAPLAGKRWIQPPKTYRVPS